jgi:hypothetical protein
MQTSTSRQKTPVNTTSNSARLAPTSSSAYEVRRIPHPPFTAGWSAASCAASMSMRADAN